MTIKDIENFIEEIAPNNLQESYDNSGLLVGSYDKEVRKVLISLDVTEQVIDEAVLKGCDMILSHHPIIFKGLKRINGDGYVERVVISAIKNDIAIYSLHTNLDNIEKGVSFKICDALNIVRREILQPKPGMEGVGAGMVGYINRPLKPKSFIGLVKDKFSALAVRHTEPTTDIIKKVAVCGGSGSFLLQDAIRAGADVFVTSDFTYHQFFDADGKIMIVDIGHYEFESFTSKLMLDLLGPLGRDREDAVDFILADTNTNPVKYM